MKTPLTVLGIVLAVVLVATGFVAAGFGPVAAPADGETPNTDADTAFGPAAHADGPLNETNSPWMADDERLERFQDRFGLSDAQMDEIGTEVTAMIQNDADRDAIRTQVRTMLESYGVEDPTLGPPGGEHLGEGPWAGSGHQNGTSGHGPMAGSGHQNGTAGYGPMAESGHQNGTAGYGPMAGSGHQGSANHGPQATGASGHGFMGGGGAHGPADGSCMN